MALEQAWTVLKSTYRNPTLPSSNFKNPDPNPHAKPCPACNEKGLAYTHLMDDEGKPGKRLGPPMCIACGWAGRTSEASDIRDQLAEEEEFARRGHPYPIPTDYQMRGGEGDDGGGQ